MSVKLVRLTMHWMMTKPVATSPHVLQEKRFQLMALVNNATITKFFSATLNAASQIVDQELKFNLMDLVNYVEIMKR